MLLNMTEQQNQQINILSVLLNVDHTCSQELSYKVVSSL